MQGAGSSFYAIKEAMNELSRDENGNRDTRCVINLISKGDKTELQFRVCEL